MRYMLTKTFIKPFLSKIKFSGDEWIFVMHIPKTAGTTFRFTLYNHIDDSLIYPNYQELTYKLKGKYPSGQELVDSGMSDLFPGKYRILIGHYQYNFIRFLNSKPKVITFLRNPLYRTKSHLIHIQKLNPRYQNHTLEEIFELTQKRMSNFQSRILGYNIDQNNINEVFENLEKLDFVGISERFNDSINLLNHTFNWPLNPVNALNKSRNLDTAISSQLENRIREILNLDFMLYQRALKIFNDNLAELK